MRESFSCYQAPAPGIVRKVALHDRVAGRLVVLGRMLDFLAVTAPDVAAGQADTQVHPIIPCLQTAFATLGTRRHVTNLVQVRALLLGHRIPLLHAPVSLSVVTWHY